MSEKKFKFSLRWIITIFISFMGCCILAMNMGKQFFLQSVEASDLFTSEKLTREYAETIASSWMWSFIAIAVILLIINVITLILKKGEETFNIALVPVIFSSVLLLTGAFWGYTYTESTKQASDMMLPKSCLSEHYDTDEVQNILKDLETVGFYDSKIDLRYYLNYANTLPLIEVQDEAGTVITSFVSKDSYDFEDSFSELGLLADGDGKWIATVKDGHVTDIALEWNEDTYYFMQDGTTTMNPNGIYYFHYMITNEDNYSSITHSAEIQIAEKHSADVESINFSWNPGKQDVINTTLDNWKVYINGTYEIDGETHDVQILAKSKTDEEIDQMTEENNIPFSWWIVE